MLEVLGQQLRKPSGLMGRLVARMMNMRNRQFYQNVINELDIRKSDRIYEIGYGPGMGIQMIAEKWADCTIAGIDFSELMYHSATQRNKKYIDTGRVQLTYGDLLTENEQPNSYDKIFCVNVIYFWNDLVGVFLKIHSLLAEEGSFCIFMTPAQDLNASFASEFNKYSIEEVEFALKEAGFIHVSSKLDKGYYIKARK